jgi:hypothetical protein
MFALRHRGETEAMAQNDNQNPQRGEDERRTNTNPADNPAPRSPAPDDEAVRKGQENLDSVTTK